MRAQRIRTIAWALRDRDVDFRVERTLDDFVARWTALPGIGPWTAHYIALRALGHPDAFPADDLVLQKAVPAEPAPAKAGGRSEEHTSELQSLMRSSYAVFCLKKKKN